MLHDVHMTREQWHDRTAHLLEVKLLADRIKHWSEQRQVDRVCVDQRAKLAAPLFGAFLVERVCSPGDCRGSFRVQTVPPTKSLVLV